MDKVATYTSTQTSYQSPPSSSTFIPQYPEPPSGDPPRAPLPPGYYQHPSDANPPQTPAQQSGSATKANGDTARSSNRLRKACDNCSIRKVKCDEGGPPCKACTSLEIPCTFARPSKRRGPANRLAESIKRQRRDQAQGLPPGQGQLSPASPTHAAHALASFSQQAYLTPEHICPWPVLQNLLDDYFVFIHPVIPVPHQDSFRASIQSREYYNSGTVIALAAAMVSCLTASFPRRARQHIKDGGLDRDFPSSRALIDRCRHIGEQAHGPPTHNRVYTVKDAIVSYLKGVTNVYTFEKDPGVLYFKEALNIIISLGFHQAPLPPDANGIIPNTPKLNGADSVDQQLPQRNTIDQEMGLRVFWLVFASVKSAEQLGATPMGISIPPNTKATPWPKYPAEVDDQQIKATGVEKAYDGHVSEMHGFNINSNLFYSYDAISRREFCDGKDELVDWPAQVREIVESLKTVNKIVVDLPPHFQLDEPTGSAQGHNYPDPENARAGAHPPSIDTNSTAGKMNVMIEIQKANIHATQLGTRSYLIDKYFVLHDEYNKRKNIHSPSSVAPNLDPDNSRDILHFIKQEYSATINTLLQMLLTVNTLYMEPNGASLISKVRSIAASLLLEKDRDEPAKGASNNLELLRVFSVKLREVQKTVLSADVENEEGEELMLRQWADLREQQQHFVNSGLFARHGG